MPKVPQTNEELKKQLNDQLDLLTIHCASYDAGKTIVAKSIATSVRVFVHDTKNSTSLLRQLSLKSNKFFDTSISPEGGPGLENTTRVGSFCGLIGMALGGKQTYMPFLDEAPPNIAGYVEFDDYWNRVIFIDNFNNKFTREEIILAVANQDGGAHVDPDIDEKYRKLARENSLGWKGSTDGKIWNDLDGSELVAVRQIGHEILRTFLQDYPLKKFHITGNEFTVAGAGMWIGTSKSQKLTIPKVGRNEKCPCKSGLKYKKCHGK